MKRLTIRGTGLSLAIFFDVTFTWLSFGSFVPGLVEVFLYGMYIALVFVPLVNYFERGERGDTEIVATSRPTVGREEITRG